MRLLIVCLLSLACPTWAAAADVWTCSYPKQVRPEVGLTGQRFGHPAIMIWWQLRGIPNAQCQGLTPL